MAKKVEVDLKLLIGVVALIIFATVGSAFATYLIFSESEFTLFADNQETEEVGRELGPTFHIGEFTVNLSANTSNRFVRTGIVVEVDHRRSVEEIETRQPQIRDRIINILRLKTMDDLNKPDGLEILKDDILSSINGILINGEVLNVFFIDLVIQ